MAKSNMKTKLKSKEKDWEKELEEEANEESAREKVSGGGGNNISIKGRRFTFGGEKLGRELRCVIVDYVYLNSYYGKKYKEGEASIPTCFALSTDGEDMEPHENSSKQQGDACKGCPQNEWGSGRGRAKACSQRRKLAILDADVLENVDDIADADIATLSLPPTSIKNWGKYVKGLKAQMSRPIWAVITKISFDTDSDYPSLVFEAEEKIEDKEVVDAIRKLRSSVRDELMTPFESRDDDDDSGEDDEGELDDEDDSDDEDKPRRKGRKKVSKRGKSKDEDDEDDDSEDEDDSDEDDEDDEDDDKPSRKARKGAGKSGFGKKKSKSKKDEDDEDDDDEDEDEEESPKKKSKSKSKKDKDDEDDDSDEDEDGDEDEDDEAPKKKSKKKKSRFS